ncbi:unnamed protein product [Lota lota]
MGNCCHAETPCASVEERSGLLDGKTAAPTDQGLEGAFLDSPTSDGSMDEIKEGEMKEEQIKAEEKTSVAAQVRQGENIPSMPQENGVVQKESVWTEAAAPPPQHQTSASEPLYPQLQSLPAAEAPYVMGTVVVATPEKQTAEVAEERRSPLSVSQEVTDPHCDITFPVADAVCVGPEERRNSHGLWKEGPPKFPPPAPGGSDPQEISNAESDSQPPPFLPKAMASQEPTPTEVEEAELHPDLPTEFRDPKETLEKSPEEDRSVESQVLNDPLPLRVNQDKEQEQEVVDVEQEAVRKGGSKEEEATGQVMGDKGVSMETPETRVGEEGKEGKPGQEPFTAPRPTAAGGDEEDEMDTEEEKADEEEKEEGKEEVPLVDPVEESDEDLYRGMEDMDSSPSSLEVTSTKVEDSCSLAPMVDLLSYSQREWRGNTTKSALIRKGYQQMMEWFGGVRRVRGDNYCALRATLFQVLSQTTQSPAWLHQDHFTMLPEELDGPDGLLSQWSFPGERQSGDGQRDATQRLQGYIELLRKTWVSAADCSTAEDRRRLCEGVFQGGEEELGLLEALKLLMLGRAAELHRRMEQGQDVPVFCWLLFARDTSPCPRTFLTNHLRHVGVSGGLEQVEMFLLGYTLRCTIQVYRLYMSGTEEFLTYYPDDHRDDWPAVSLVTEDDRHYNVPVVTAIAAPEAPSR